MRLLLFLCSIALSFPLFAQENDTWKPATSPLMTRWAKDVNPQNPLPDYPRPQMTRATWLSLNGLWQFENAGNASSIPRNRILPERVLVPFPIQSALSGVGQKYKQVWYRRTFEIPSAWKKAPDQHVLLHFGAVNYESGIYFNGKLIGTHKGGYDPFSFDITERLQEGQNELIVGVIHQANWSDIVRGRQNSDARSGFYSAATGIWQTVWLEPVSAAHIEDLTITPDVDGSVLEIRADTVNAEGENVTIDVLDGTAVVAQGRGAAGTAIRVPIPNPKLWSPANPFLYSLKINLLKNNEIVDSVGSYAALRKISVGPDETGKTRLLLNNKPLFQVGVLDAGYWPDGIYTAPTDEALKFDIEAAKKLGFNLIRKHAKIEPARWYYHADKLGMLVWQDMPGGENKTPQTKRQFETELRRMVETLRHHPSIVMWVLFDEGKGQFDAERLAQTLKIQDPTRLVSNASGGDDKYAGDVHDTHNFPSPRSNAPEAKRAAVVGEFGALPYYVADHSWSDHFEVQEKEGKQEKFDEAEGLTRRYENLMRQAWKLKENTGTGAVVYAQLTDIEKDVTGFYSYDRAVLKTEEARIHAANSGPLPPKPLTMLATTAQKEPVEWKYTTKRPQEGWEREGYDDLDWKSSPAPFGTLDKPEMPVRTEWKTHEIWLRRTIELPADFKTPLLLLLHDDDATIYINGILAAKVTGKNDEYEEIPLLTSGREALQPGKNLIAVMVTQKEGNQVFDLGLGAY